MDTDHELDSGRRRTLVAGGAAMAALVASTPGAALGQIGAPPPSTGSLPVQDIQRILRSTGHVSGPVLHITQLRGDLNNVVGPANIPFRPAFAVHNSFYFQATANGGAILNGEFSLQAREINAVIDRILVTGMEFQALHQHFFDLEPQIWQVHVRGQGSPYAIARALEFVVRATGTPLPQVAPLNPTSPLDARRLGQLLGGLVEIHPGGVVAVTIPRREQITLNGVPVDPRLGVSHEILFEPLVDGRTAVAPALALVVGGEVGSVMGFMRKQGFDIHALVNHEKAEVPQLFFAHLLAVGNPYYYARVIRQALQLTNTRFLF